MERKRAERRRLSVGPVRARHLVTLSLLCGVMGANGCLFEDPVEEEGTNVVIPPGSIEVVEGIYLVGAEKSSEPMPTPSGSPDAPVIEAAYFQNTGESSFVVVVETTNAPVEQMHVEINGEHYIVDVDLVTTSGEITSIDACEIVAQQQGYTCTQACLEACGCLDCSDTFGEDALEGACAATCSIASAQGTLSSEPYNGSEAVFADVTYYGYDAPDGTHVSGVLEQTPYSCDGSSCRDAANQDKSSYSFGFVAVDYSFVSDLNVGSQIAESPPQADRPSLTSNSYPGTLNSNACARPFSECY